MIFHGIEKEGRYKGIKTLFIGHDTTKGNIIHWCEKHQINHIYLGAGRSYQQHIDNQTVSDLIKSGYILSFETLFKPTLDPAILSQIHVILTLSPANIHSLDLSWLKSNHSVKIEDSEQLLVFPVNTSELTELSTLKDNTYYEGDVILEEK